MQNKGENGSIVMAFGGNAAYRSQITKSSVTEINSMIEEMGSFKQRKNCVYYKLEEANFMIFVQLRALYDSRIFTCNARLQTKRPTFLLVTTCPVSEAVRIPFQSCPTQLCL